MDVLKTTLWLILTCVITLFIAQLLMVGRTGTFTICNYYTVCHINTSLSSPTFDCGIIYSRTHNDSIAAIRDAACSPEVLNILGKQFNTIFLPEKCSYVCCLTDGDSCSTLGGDAVNNQGYEWSYR
jgi:hypothetical protein